MANGEIKILDKLYINQNIICLVISYIGVVYIARLDVNDECLCCLVYSVGWLCSILFFVCALSVTSSMIFYAIEYGVKKCYKAKSHKLHKEYRQNVVERMNHNDSAASYKIDDIIKIKDIF